MPIVPAVRGAKWPIKTTYTSPRLDESELLKRYGTFHKKLARTKHLARNNFLAHAVVGMQKTFVTSGGFHPTGADPLRSAIWEGWTKLADFEQTKSFNDVLNEICGDMVTGDCLVILRSKKIPSQNRVSSFVQIVNAGRVCTPEHFVGDKNPDNGNSVILGVEFSDGEEIGYWVFNGVYGAASTKADFVFVPRFNPDTGRFVSLLMRNPETAANSVRGAGVFDSTIPEMEDCADITDSSRQSAKVKSDISLIITTDNPDEWNKNLGAVNTDGTDNTEEDALGNIRIIGEMPSGSVMAAPIGTDAKVITHSGNIDLNALIKMTKQNFAAGICRPYEILFNDYAGVNFSAGKLLHDPFWRSVEMWTNRFRYLCQLLYEAVTDEGLLIRGINPMTISRRVVRWVGAPKTEADENKATAAAAAKVSSGFMAPSRYHAERGMEYIDILNAYAADIASEKLVFDGKSPTLASLMSSPNFKHLVSMALPSVNDEIPDLVE